VATRTVDNTLKVILITPGTITNAIKRSSMSADMITVIVRPLLTEEERQD
jgi:hypothetical protein